MTEILADQSELKTEKPIILICGFGRCGTSLVMQMLERGGFHVIGQYPAFEEYPASNNLEFWRDNYAGKAIKVLDPHVRRPPAGLSYKAIWLDRNPIEQAKSQLKFLAWMGIPSDTHPKAVKKLQKSLKRDRNLAINSLYSICGINNCFQASFEDLITFPRSNAMRLLGIIWPEMDYADRLGHARKMVEIVKLRSYDCYNGMLEERLMAEATKSRYIERDEFANS